MPFSPKLIIVSLLTFLTLGTAGQEKVEQGNRKDPVQLSGIIKDEFGDVLPYSHIIILNKGMGSIADRRGRFSFIVHPGDTLVFSSLGHKRETMVIPVDLNVIHYSVNIELERDPFQIDEVTVWPWATYEQFSEAFIALDLPEDDYDRAMANIALIQTWMELEGLPADPAASFRIAMQSHHNRQMYAGQPPNNLLNPFSWAQFIQAIREGRFTGR